MRPGADDITRAFKAVHTVLDPLTIGDGETDAVREARLAMQSLHLLRQWARRGVKVERAKLKQSRETEA